MAKRKDESAEDRMLMAPGIETPLVVPEGGHEGARAVSEYCYMAEGRFVEHGSPIEEKKKYVDYDGDFKKVPVVYDNSSRVKESGNE